MDVAVAARYHLWADNGLMRFKATKELSEDGDWVMWEDYEALVNAAVDYMSQIGQGYAAYGFMFGEAQHNADKALRSILGDITTDSQRRHPKCT